jgi:cyanophycinase
MSKTKGMETRMTRKRVTLSGLGLVAAMMTGVWGQLFAGEPPKPQDKPPAAAVAVKAGALFICGGGKLPEDVRLRFIELAGGAAKAKIVVIPTAHALADAANADTIYLQPWRDQGVKTISMLHTRSRATADDPTFANPLKEATAVWISGGKQTTLTDLYGGTEVERQLKAILERGGVVGGTSAGAAVMTRVMIQSGRTEAREGQGFDLLAGAVVDQHFIKRKRMERMVGLLKKHPELLGFGIDESTALLVRGNLLTVLGDSCVVACLPAQGEEAPQVKFLRKGDEADLASLRGPAPKIVTALGAEELTSNK